MSRRREEKRKKREELGRQLGVSAADAPHDLEERSRITRPQARLRGRARRGGVIERLRGVPSQIVLGLWLVEDRGARLLYGGPVTTSWVELDKVSYARPAHFVALVVHTDDAAPIAQSLALPALTIDGRSVTDKAFADASWESPRAVALGGLSIARGAAVSVRGVGRASSTYVFPLDREDVSVELHT